MSVLLPLKTIPKRSHNASTTKDKGRDRTVIGHLVMKKRSHNRGRDLLF